VRWGGWQPQFPRHAKVSMRASEDLAKGTTETCSPSRVHVLAPPLVRPSHRPDAASVTPVTHAPVIAVRERDPGQRLPHRRRFASHPQARAIVGTLPLPTTRILQQRRSEEASPDAVGGGLRQSHPLIVPPPSPSPSREPSANNKDKATSSRHRHASPSHQVPGTISTPATGRPPSNNNTTTHTLAAIETKGEIRELITYISSPTSLIIADIRIFPPATQRCDDPRSARADPPVDAAVPRLSAPWRDGSAHDEIPC
jgi:hypothetical protein